ncbi:MAG TPA: phosphoenolpyruvate--protein phosphotransferase [Armatimonadota bacterium]|jgi:fructose-specific PTS system IIA-like component
MPCEYTFEFPLEHGLHARPASVLRDAADAHRSEVHLLNARNGHQANAKSVLSLVAADVHRGDACTLTVEGPDEDTAFPSLQAFLTDVFPNCDEPLPVPEESGSEGAAPPRVVTTSGARSLRGTAAVPGVAIAPAFVTEEEPFPEVPPTTNAPMRALAAFETAVGETASDMDDSLARAANATERDILHAHLAILRDPEYRDRVNAGIRGGSSAGKAIVDAERYYAELLGSSESAYLRERALDVRDVCTQLLRRLYPEAAVSHRPAPNGPCILVAPDLTPSEFLAQDKTLLKGLVLSEGGATSHTVILARAAGIPCVTGARDAHLILLTGQPLVLDARRGLVLPNPPESVIRYYRLDIDRAERRREQLKGYITATGHTADGRRVEVAANAATDEEAESAFLNGAEGIGLFRTEMLFMDRQTPPDEEEQYRTYAGVVKAAAGRPVIIRTLDVGGDKPVPYLDLPTEANPFLGYRAVRFYGEHEALVRTQLRAILRAAALGPVRVMVPMVSCVEEVRQMKAMAASVADELAAKDVPAGAVELGIMVEVPSTAMVIDQLALECEFFSIGTNDLAQYLLAVDRGNGKVGRLYNCLQPALLRLLKKIVDDAHAAGRWVGMCGEMAGNERLAPLLVGLGLDELSMAGPSVPAMKAAVARLNDAECVALLADCMRQPTLADVDGVLTAFTPEGETPSVLDSAITNLSSEALSREEAIKELVDLLALGGRVSNADGVEDAVWAREDVYSTGVGYGFAIPHCKTPHVSANSIGILKLNHSIEWKTLDGEPVRIVLMLAIRESAQGEEHLRIFAKLARKIMHEDFRERLLSEKDPDALIQYIEENLA